MYSFVAQMAAERVHCSVFSVKYVQTVVQVVSLMLQYLLLHENSTVASLFLPFFYSYGLFLEGVLLNLRGESCFMFLR
jgi:hypothetical protein